MIIQNGDFKVYIHANKINGKMYVGITKMPVEKRWRNGDGYIGCSHFYNAICKYGWDNFDHSIFASHLTEEEAMNMESLLIEKFELQNPKYGYNIRHGGKNCSLTEETKKKISNALRGRKQTEEQRRINSEVHKGRKLSKEHVAAISRGNKGRPRTEKELIAAKLNGERMSGDNHWTRRLGMKEETKQKISTTLIEFFQTHKQHDSVNKKKVLQVETGSIFDSIEDAAKAVGACRSQVSEAAVGIKRKTAKGFHWKFV